MINILVKSFYRKLFENENYFQKIMENKSLIIKLKGEIKLFENQDVFEIIKSR